MFNLRESNKIYQQVREISGALFRLENVVLFVSTCRMSKCRGFKMSRFVRFGDGWEFCGADIVEGSSCGKV